MLAEPYHPPAVSVCVLVSVGDVGSVVCDVEPAQDGGRYHRFRAGTDRAPERRLGKLWLVMKLCGVIKRWLMHQIFPR